MIKCAECSHFHDQVTRLLCDAGIMDVQMIGNVKVVAEMTHCDRFDPNNAFLATNKVPIMEIKKRGRPIKHE